MAKKLIALVLGIMMLMTVAVSGIAEEKSDLHIADDVTLRFFFDLDLAANVPGMQDYNDSDAYKWLEEQTGIHIEWIHPASGTSREAFNLLFASDDMPDLIYNSIPNGFVYPSGHDMAIADGVYANLKDYEDLMPNYMAIVNSNETLKRESVTDEGNRWCFFYIYKDGRGPNFGPTIRKDFLDKVGMDLPETYDDWHEVLTAFKEQLGLEIPLYVNKDTFMWYSEFAAGYGVTKDWSLNTEGKVIYGPCEDGYGEYLDMMQQWYKEGLIDQSFSVHDGRWPENDLLLNDKVGAFPIYTSWTGHDYYAKQGATNPDFNLVGTKIPVKEGGEAHYRMPDMLTNTYCIAVNAQSKHLEEAIRWMDAQYGEEAAFVMNYGVTEGKEDGSYYFDDNGPHWGGLITNNPDGLTQGQARQRYTTNNAPYEDYNRVMGTWTDIQRETQARLMESDYSAYISDSITMTEAEQEEFSDIMGDITTFATEFTVNYVMGNASQSFDEFRAQLKAMNIDRAIELKQAAVDRYNAR